MIPEGRLCACGQPSDVSLLVHYRYPRAEWLPEAMDPYYVHGSAGWMLTCGDLQCEPDAFLACLERAASGLSAVQAAGLELEVIA